MAEVAEFITSDLTAVFGAGFVAGFGICALIYAVRALVNLFVRIVKS